MRRRTAAVLTASLLLPLFAFGGAGCKNSTRVGQIRANPSPELRGLSNTRDERLNRWSIVRGTNLRNSQSAAARAIYVDRPTRLTPSVVPY